MQLKVASSDCLIANKRNTLLCIKIQHNVLHCILCLKMFFTFDENENVRGEFAFWSKTASKQRQQASIGKLDQKSRVSPKISGSKQTRIEFKSRTSIKLKSSLYSKIHGDQSCTYVTRVTVSRLLFEQRTIKTQFGRKKDMNEMNTNCVCVYLKLWNYWNMHANTIYVMSGNAKLIFNSIFDGNYYLRKKKTTTE